MKGFGELPKLFSLIIKMSKRIVQVQYEYLENLLLENERLKDSNEQLSKSLESALLAMEKKVTKKRCQRGHRRVGDTCIAKASQRSRGRLCK